MFGAGLLVELLLLVVLEGVFGISASFVLLACTGGEHVPARERAGGPVTKPRARWGRGSASSRGLAADHSSCWSLFQRSKLEPDTQSEIPVHQRSIIGFRARPFGAGAGASGSAAKGYAPYESLPHARYTPTQGMQPKLSGDHFSVSRL